jgi:hypothetical protein
MKSFWTPARDRKIKAMEAAGKSAREIAKALGGGVSRNAVIGRSRRLRGIVYESDILSWDRANAKRMAEAKARAKVRTEKERKALRELAKALSAGIAPGKAMGRAFRAGARWRAIGKHFRMSPQAAYEAAKRARASRK